MGEIKEAVIREYVSALQQHQIPLRDGLKRIMEQIEHQELMKVKAELASERRDLTYDEEVSVLKVEAEKILRSVIGLASAGHSEKAENQRALFDLLMPLLPNNLAAELIDELLDWEPKKSKASPIETSTSVSQNVLWVVETVAFLEKPYRDGQGNLIGESGFSGVIGVPGRRDSIMRDLENNEWLDLSRTNLYGFDFNGLLLEQHDMSYSLLQKANFDDTRISFVSFAHSDARGASFRGSTCYTLFLYSNLQYADFRNAVLSNSDFRYADLSNSNLCNADLTGAALSSTNFDGAKIDGARFSEDGLSIAKIYNPNVDFSVVDVRP